MRNGKVKQIAFHIGKSWQRHHHGDNDGMLFHMTEIVRIFVPNISYGEAEKVARYQLEAFLAHNAAEEFEDKGLQKEADEYWNKVYEWNVKYCSALFQHVE